MMMLTNLIIIILIVVISYILCLMHKYMSCQISHIICGLSVLILIHILNSPAVQQLISSKTTKSGNKEGFEQLPDTINSFLLGENINRPSPQSIATMSPAASQQYLSKLDSLINAIDSLRQDNQTTNTALSSNNISTVDRLNLESLQQYQNFQIQYLQNQINKTKDLINSQQMSEQSKQYKPIKVYSSCVSGETANSQMSATPLSHNQQLSSTTPQQILNTMSQSNGTTGPLLYQQQQQQKPTPAINLSASTGSLGALLNQALSSNGVNINLGNL